MLDENTNPNIKITLRTLLSGGFVLDSAQRQPGYMIFFTHRFDEFGTPQKYCFALADDRLSEVHLDCVIMDAIHLANGDRRNEMIGKFRVGSRRSLGKWRLADKSKRL